MKRISLSILCLLTLSIADAVAAQQQCVCTTGCKIAVWNNAWAAPGQPAAPTSCTVYKGGSSLATGSAVAGALITNVNVCQPADTSVTPSTTMCLVTIPAQAAGSVTVTATASNAAGETAQSAPFTFSSVSTLATLPPVPLNLRVAQ